MIKITLPDGSVREYEGAAVTGTQIAESIGTGLAKAALAVTVDGVQHDLSDPITKDAAVSIITIDSEEGLEIMRHTVAAQVLARAVKTLYPKAKLAIGPTIVSITTLHLKSRFQQKTYQRLKKKCAGLLKPTHRLQKR